MKTPNSVDPLEVSLEFPAEGVTSTVAVTRVAEGLLRLESVVPMIDCVVFGDTVRVTALTATLYRFEHVAVSGGWRQHSYLVPGVEAARDLIAEIERRGAHWEIVFGGLFTVCVPPSLSDWDAEATAAELLPAGNPLR